MVLLFSNKTCSQSKYNSFGKGINISKEEVIKISIENFFKIYEVDFNEREKLDIIDNFGKEFFKNEIVFNNHINDKSILIIKTNLIDESYISKGESLIGLDEVQSLIDYSKLTKEIINELLDQYTSELKIQDVFDFDFSVSDKKINSIEDTINVELKNKVIFNKTFVSFLESIIFVLDEIKMNQEQINNSTKNNLDLYPVIILGNNKSFSGLFLNNEIQYKLQILVDKIHSLIKFHSIKDNLRNVYRPSSYLLNDNNFFVRYDNNDWKNFNFQEQNVIKKIIGSNYIESESRSELINYFKNNILKNSNCFYSDDSTIENLIIYNSKFKLIFPYNIISIKCVNNYSPFIEYYYNLKFSIDDSKKLNLKFEVLSNKN
tara:strand:- start:26 stop:1150 length:1125 start_codon:yes stop_codon:yes gene_type:complete